MLSSTGVVWGQILLLPKISKLAWFLLTRHIWLSFTTSHYNKWEVKVVLCEMNVELHDMASVVCVLAMTTIIFFLIIFFSLLDLILLYTNPFQCWCSFWLIDKESFFIYFFRFCYCCIIMTYDELSFHILVHFLIIFTNASISCPYVVLHIYT